MGAGLLNQLSEGSNPSRGAINIIPGFGEMDIITVFETAGGGSIPSSPASVVFLQIVQNIVDMLPCLLYNRDLVS